MVADAQQQAPADNGEGREGQLPMSPDGGILCRNEVDAEGNPAGGYATARGISIAWQDGPLGRGADRKEPNGAFIEDVVAVCINRMEFYQGGKFACEENAVALNHLKGALKMLNKRTANRKGRGVEGTHEV